MLVRVLAVLVASLLALTLLATASDVPRYDPVAWCTEVASTGGGMSEVIKAECIRGEQSSYDTLKDTWSTFPVKSRKWCDEVARTGSDGSYVILEQCLSQESDSKQRNDNSTFKF